MKKRNYLFIDSLVFDLNVNLATSITALRNILSQMMYMQVRIIRVKSYSIKYLL